MTLARSRAIDWLRSRRGQSHELEHPLEEVSELQDARPNPEKATIEAGRAGVVRKAMTELPADQRQAIELAYFLGMSHSEIASRAGLPLGTVKTRIRLGMVRLRELLGSYAEEM